MKQWRGHFWVLALLMSPFAAAAAEPEHIDLSGPGWKVWLDKSAPWQDDRLYLPGEASLDSLPRNPPTGGWKALTNAAAAPCAIPATVEEYFANGQSLYTYHGVSWFYRTIRIPASWRGKRIRLDFAETRLRAELYVNEQLCGYDLVGETPWGADITPYVTFGAANRIAVRITNPGGMRGWEDFGALSWGRYELPSSHDFGGITGTVTLSATPRCYADELFVQNRPPAGENNLRISAVLHNLLPADRDLDINMAILPDSGGAPLWQQSRQVRIAGGVEQLFEVDCRVPAAELWQIDAPRLYHCRMIVTGGGERQELGTRFGFRLFEVRHVGGEDQFYFNGRRFRHKSAIDWGYYAGTGLYASDDQARRTVEAARAIGHNGINFHRCIGEPRVMEYADRFGLYIYEEPGGFHAGQQGYTVPDGTFMGRIMEEKCRRMAIRDRNHPSLIIHNLCNEDNYWNPLRERVMRTIHAINPGVMVCNSSGGYIYDIFQNSSSNRIPHIRPYEMEIREDYEDNHTVEEHRGIFYEPFLFAHPYEANSLQYWGEVHCYGGPDNWFATAADLAGRKNWDQGYFAPMAEKIRQYFTDNDLAHCGSGIIASPADVSRQAGRGLMYIDGRAAQNLMSRAKVDGFAINGWSGTSQVVWEAGGYWTAAITDASRNLKGPAQDYAWWIRPLQLCIKRLNGKMFAPEQVALFEITLINEGVLAAGDYTLRLQIRDGDGKQTSYASEMPVHVNGGDCFAQPLKVLPVKFRDWNAGHLTLEARLWQGDRIAAEGAEQVLLRNRDSYAENIAPFSGAIYKWPAARQAVLDARVTVSDFSTASDKLSFICAGALPDAATCDEMLRRVREDGTLLIVPFNAEWAARLWEKKLLAEQPRFAPCRIHGSWAGNGWGYLDYFIGDQAIPGGATIGTNSWEAGELTREREPQGFWPLRTIHSECRTHAYGAHFSGPDELLITLGEIEYGRGAILLNAGYRIDDDHPLTDHLFYNFIARGCREKYARPQAKSPYPGKPAAIPGVIEAENYDLGGEGLGYHDADEPNQGKEYRYEGVDILTSIDITFVGWMDRGEWLDYTVEVAKTGTYAVTFHYAEPGTTSALALEFNGADATGAVVLPSTGDWFAFRMHEIQVKLTAGVQNMRIRVIEGGANLSSLRFRHLE